MKQLYGKLWVKCTAIALLVVFAVLFAAAALGSAYLIRYGAFADGGEQVRQMAENNLLQQTRGDGWAALHAWAEDDTVSRNLLRDRYDPLTSNIYFKLTDKDTGEILFSTGALNKDDYSGKASAYYQQDMSTSLSDGSDVTVVYQAYLKSPLAPRDSALYVMTWVERLINARYLLIMLAIVLLAVCLFLFIFLLCSMGHKEGVDGFCIVSSDSDYTRLASRIRESGREVLGFGEKKTPKPFIKSCDKFIYVEILGQTPPEKAAPAKKKADAKRSAGAEAPVGPAAETAGEKKPSPDAGHASTIIRPFDDEFRTLLENTIDDAADDSGWASLGDVGSVLSKKMPDFDPRNYGYKKLSLLVRALSDAVDMKTEQQRVYVRNRVG